MKFKKATVLTVIASVCLVAGTTMVFATSAQEQENNVSPGETTISVGETNVDPVGEPKTDDADKSEAEPIISTIPDTISDPQTTDNETSGEINNTADNETVQNDEECLFVIGSEIPYEEGGIILVDSDRVTRYFPLPDKYWNALTDSYFDEDGNMVARFEHVEDDGKDDDDYDYEIEVDDGFIRGKF